jgi:hypothetical protein
MYDAEEEAWKDLARQQDLQRMDEAFRRYMEQNKPEASPSLVREAFAAGWRARSEAR